MPDISRWVARIRAPLSVKFQAIFLLLCIVLLVTAVVSLSAIGRMRTQATQLDRLNDAVRWATGLELSIVAQEHQSSMLVLTRDETHYQKLVAERRRFKEALAELGKHPVDIAEIEAACRRYEQASEATAEAVRAGARERAQKLHIQQEHAIAHEIEALIRPVVARMQDARQAGLVQISREQRQVGWIVGGLFVCSIALAVALGGLLARSIVAPIRRVNDALEQIARGEFVSVADVVNRCEIGSLAAHVNLMSRQLADLYAREREVSRQLQEQIESLQRTQAQLVQAEKLSALGRLVAGVAHELNNPLQAIQGFSELVAERPGLDPETRQEVHTILEQTDRAARIVKNLSVFARASGPERVPTDLNDVIAKAVELKRYQLEVDGIQVHQHLEPDLPLAPLDSIQMQQVFLNLINNAHDVLRERGGGHLTLRSRWDRRGQRVVAEVIDDGPGILPRHLSKIFEPFFTTKEVGRGTGLGLSICHGIIAEHGGEISVQSAPGQGATFTVSLPLSQTQVAVMRPATF
jgi:signal transduction histidine kinase